MWATDRGHLKRVFFVIVMPGKVLQIMGFRSSRNRLQLAWLWWVQLVLRGVGHPRRGRLRKLGQHGGTQRLRDCGELIVSEIFLAGRYGHAESKLFGAEIAIGQSAAVFD